MRTHPGGGVMNSFTVFQQGRIMARRNHFSFVHLDVFARRALEGNPLAVFPDARGLSADEMQTIAREMRLSETTFIIPRARKTEKTKGVRTRIFTVQEELPFAGHPTLGTAWLLREETKRNRIVLDLNVGSIPVEFSSREGRVFGEMLQKDPTWGMTHSTAKVAVVLGVEPSELDSRAAIETVSTGLPFIIVPFRSLETLRKLQPNTARMAEYCRSTNSSMFYLVSSETENPGARLHARMLFYGGEDPATGSAAGPTAAWMVRHGWTKPGEQVWIEQGLEVSRPSQIFVRAGGNRGRPTKVRVGGFCFEVIRGELAIPRLT